uniref:DUF7053 domain-containing protein n=1 Tax=Schizophyllum commune (strain H4-8 / FGSC 9210) TaxID=578458 RepID=D8PQU5_SCHCM
MPLPWPLVLTRTVSSTTPINAPTDAVIQYLHDPDRMVSGGSLVIDRKVDPSNPLKYTITDKLDVLGLWSSTTTYDALFEPKDEGTDVTVNAPMGTRLQQRWRVRGKDEGSAEMTEDVEVQALFFFMPYILRTMIKSHREGNERIRAQLEGKHVALKRLSSRGDDPYGLFHLALNRRMGDPINVDPKTEWLNMGYWKNTSDLPTACEALALRMVQAARPRPNGRVLEHVKHPFNPADDLRFDTILALDCAYHFQTRKAFLQQALSNLAVGGRIALADIAFDDLTLDTHRSKLIRAALRMMPSDNVWTKTTYVKNMEQIGYVDVTLEDITDEVFPGFVRFLKSRGRGWWAFGALMEVYFSAGAKVRDGRILAALLERRQLSND